MIDFPDDEVAFMGLRGPLRLEDVLFQAKKSSRIAPLQIVRADRVIGAEHVRSAAAHAVRSMREERNHAKTLEVEFVRYLAGERQVKAALEKVGLPAEGAREAIAIAFGPHRQDGLLHFSDSLGFDEDDSLAQATQSKLLDFGITSLQLAATTPDRHLHLVLEAVAAVDLMRA